MSAPGSRGDVNPMVAIGKQLRALGYEVIISLAEPYAGVATAAGLIAEPVIAQSRFEAMLSDPSVWKPIRGARAIFREVAGDFLELHWDVIRKHHIAGQTILVSHPLDLASRIHRDFDPSTPLVDVHLAPSMLRTLDQPPRMTPWPIEVSRPRWLVKAAYRLVDAIGIDPVIAPRVNSMRRSLGLTPVRRVIHDWWLSPDRILAMYPDWYAPATSGFRPQLMHCGFPLSDGVEETEPSLPADRSPADRSPEDRPAADRPIVFTAGTAHHHSREFFQRATDFCRRSGRQGLLVSTHEANFPESLPENVHAQRYVSFGNLLPACAAIVHHGGIGTTSQAFAAGIPQIVRPMAFDQFDNAARIERLNCGLAAGRDRRLGDLIEQVVRDPAIGESCRSVGAKITFDATRLAALEVDRTAARFGNTPAHSSSQNPTQNPTP